MTTNMYDVSSKGLKVTTKPASAVEVVIDYIQSQILQRKLRIGDKLPSEGELCELLDVGRGSVREATKRLEALQLLDIRRGDGTYISTSQESTALDALLYKIVLEDISFQQILDYRIQLEVSIVSLSIRNCTPEILEELHANCDAFASYIGSEEAKAPNILHDLDLEFHSLLGKASGNQLLSDVYHASLQLFSPYILQNYQQGQIYEDPQETAENHRILLEAIEKKDVTGGIYAVHNSMKLWQKWVLADQD